MTSKERRNGAADSAVSNDEVVSEKAVVKANGGLDSKRYADEEEIEGLTIEEADKDKEEEGQEQAEENGKDDKVAKSDSVVESQKSDDSAEKRRGRWQEERKTTYELKEKSAGADSEGESESPSSVTVRERWQSES